mmetsp:Transcript_1250/g.3861  ORF Transcript_1250/g.3861 Transcript_1250/m.3861 type:complete len:251 (-) Transcript_1250:1297-2049(-)
MAVPCDPGVKLRVLQLLHGHQQALREAGAKGLCIQLGVAEAAHQQLWRWGPVAVDGGARSEVDVGCGPHLLVDPLEAVDPVEARQLQQVHEGGPHVAPKAVLAPFLRLAPEREHGEAGVAGGLRQSDADLAHPCSLEDIRLPDKGLRALLEHPLHTLVGVVETGAVRDLWEGVPADDEVEHVQARLASTGPCRLLEQRRQGFACERALKLLEARKEQQDAPAVVGLALACGVPLRPGRPRQLTLARHLQL